MTISDDQEEAVNSICSFPLYVVLTKPELRCSIEFFSKYFFFLFLHMEIGQHCKQGMVTGLFI